MWKIIIICALVIILGGSFVYYKNQQAMVMTGGEAETVQTQFQDAVKKLKDINTDKYIKTYAQMRERHFSKLSSDLRAEKESLDAETEATNTKIAETEAEIQRSEEELQSLQQELEKYTREAAELVGISASSADFDLITQKVTDLVLENEDLRVKIDKEDRTISALSVESDRLTKMIADLRKLAQDRQARLSPVELECVVSYVDPNWGYVLLDAGINKGIVIGSRLAVMRGDVKICELNVTNVETRKASGEVVRSTLMTAEQVRPGDRVIAVRNDNK